MGRETGISWTDSTWNPIRGCSRVSEGCRNCYAESVAHRFSGAGLPYEGLVHLDSNGKSTGKWNGQIKFVESHLLDPLKWKEPRRIFVNSMSDLFHENVTDEMRDQIFAVMAICPQHMFQVLTKRPQRMLAYLRRIQDDDKDMQAWINAAIDLPTGGENKRCVEECDWPLPNVQLGVSIEDQKSADERVPILLDTPAAVRFISAEPLLGEVRLGKTHGLPIFESRGARMRGMPAGNDLGPIPDGWYAHTRHTIPAQSWIDWVIVGGESGKGARPMQEEWARSLRDQCDAAGVAFFMKQMGSVFGAHKGENIPEDLSIKQFPGVQGA